jgi:hypothetical protein
VIDKATGKPVYVYEYTVDPENLAQAVKVENDGNVILTFGKEVYQNKDYQASYDIQIN